MRWGLRRDFWTAVRPDIGALDRPIREANRQFEGAADDDRIASASGSWSSATARTRRPPATFRAIVSPLVTWIWIGGAIVVSAAA